MGSACAFLRRIQHEEDVLFKKRPGYQTQAEAGRGQWEASAKPQCAALSARVTMKKGVFFFPLTLCPTYSIPWLLKLNLTRGSRFSPHGLGIDQFPAGLGRSRRGPPCLGLGRKALVAVGMLLTLKP